MRSSVHRLTLTDPGDVSPLAEAIERGELNPATIVAVIGKTPGNGLVNDYTRGYLTQSLALLIGEHTAIHWRRIIERIPFIFSGGTEGVLTPHITVFCTEPDGNSDGRPTLAIATAFTPELAPQAIGRKAQAMDTAEAVRVAMGAAGIDDPADVHFVQVKGPCLTASQISAAAASGLDVAGGNADKSMALSRVASAFGVALALGEISEDQLDDSAFLKDFTLYSGVASCSSGVEVRCNEIVLLGNSRKWAGDYRISHRPMADALDISALYELLDDLQLEPIALSKSFAQNTTGTRSESPVMAAFVKCEADRRGLIRGQPHTMLNDGDMNQQRHIRGAVGAIAAAVLADTRIFVSGGAEHQGPDGGGIVTAIARKPEPDLQS